MIIVIAKAQLKEGKKEAFKKQALELVEKTRQEPGNISYRLLEGVDNPDRMTFLEEWKDQASLERHCNTEHFQRILPLLAGFQIEETSIAVSTVVF